MFRHFREETVVTEGYVRATGQACENISFKLIYEIGCNTGDVWTSIVLMQTHPAESFELSAQLAYVFYAHKLVSVDFTLSGMNGVVFFAYQKRITERDSYLLNEMNKTSVSKPRLNVAAC